MNIPSEVSLIDHLGHPVSLTLLRPLGAKGVAVLSHGFGSNRNTRLFVELEELLVARGIAVLRYEYYGHGPAYVVSGGSQLNRDVTLTKCVASLRRVVSFCREEGLLKIALLGSSFGGLVSLVVASSDPEFAALSLRSPVSDPTSFWRYRLSAEEFAVWRESGALKLTAYGEDFELEFDFWRDLENYRTMECARAIRCPIQIVHGDKDETVPIQQSLALAKLLGIEVRVVKGADHRYSQPEHFEEMRVVIGEFLIANLS